MNLLRLTLSALTLLALAAALPQSSQAGGITWERFTPCSVSTDIDCQQLPPQSGDNGLHFVDSGNIAMPNCSPVLALGSSCSDTFSYIFADFSIQGSISASSGPDASYYSSGITATVTDRSGSPYRIALLTSQQFSYLPACDFPATCDPVHYTNSGTLTGGFNVANPSADKGLNSLYIWNYNFPFGPTFEASNAGSTFSTNTTGPVEYYPGFFPIDLQTTTNFDFLGSGVVAGDAMDIPLNVQLTPASATPEPAAFFLASAVIGLLAARRYRPRS